MGIRRKYIDKKGVQFDGMRAFYINALLRSLAFAMVGIFTPIFIYQTMLPVIGSASRAIAMIGVFYLVVRGIVLVLDIPVAKLVERLGFRRSVLVSVILLIGYFGSMSLAGKNHGWLIVGAVLLGVSLPFYWISRGAVIAIDSKKSDLGKQVGFLSVLERIAGVAGPVGAGFIAEVWGFSFMYGGAMLVLIASVVPLFSMPHHLHRNGVSLRGYLLWLRDRRFFHQGISSMARAMDDYSVSVVWPLTIFLFGIHYGELGAIFSVLTILAIMVRYGGGLVFDKLYKKGGFEDEILYLLVSLGAAIMWLVRLMVKSVSGVLWVDGLGGSFGTTYRNVSDDYSVLGGKRMHEIAYYTYKQMSYTIGVLLFCIVFVLGAWLGVWKELTFGMTSFWLLLSVVQARESNLK